LPLYISFLLYLFSYLLIYGITSLLGMISPGLVKSVGTI
jgi:hypothetical protein